MMSDCAQHVCWPFLSRRTMGKTAPLVPRSLLRVIIVLELLEESLSYENVGRPRVFVIVLDGGKKAQVLRKWIKRWWLISNT